MKILVTGAAGFIGSHLCEKLLLDSSNEVIGLDAFVQKSPTPIPVREYNLRYLLPHPRFTFINQDLLHVPWAEILPGVNIVYHLAGMPGVRSSWGDDFKSYVTNNIEATQKLLEACRTYPVSKIVYASTSSVYGEKTNQVNETATTEPLSPYGVTKLTGEQLCKVYMTKDALPIVVLRFFTVYGPRQRPDMAFHRFIQHIHSNKPIPINGDGLQTRDFTFVGDCVEGIAATAHAANIIGETINIGGLERASVLDCIAILEELFDRKVERQFLGKASGEPRHTWADISKAQRLLGYQPKIDLRTGLQAEITDLLQTPYM